MPSLNENIYRLIRDVALTRRAAPVPIDLEPRVAPELLELIRLRAENIAREGEVDRLTELLEIVVADNGRLKDQLVAYSRALSANHARFKIEKYLRMAYTIASERRMPGETVEAAAFERLSATRELELTGRIVMENVAGPVSAP